MDLCLSSPRRVAQLRVREEDPDEALVRLVGQGRHGDGQQLLEPRGDELGELTLALHEARLDDRDGVGCAAAAAAEPVRDVEGRGFCRSCGAE